MSWLAYEKIDKTTNKLNKNKVNFHMDFFCKSSDHHCKNQPTQKCIQLEQGKMKSVTVVL